MPSFPPNPLYITNIDNNDNNIVPLLVGSNILVHYAILGLFGLLGATIAHVQIVMHLICPSCQVIYWYMVLWILCDDGCDNEHDDSRTGGRSGCGGGWQLFRRTT